MRPPIKPSVLAFTGRGCRGARALGVCVAGEAGSSGTGMVRNSYNIRGSKRGSKRLLCPYRLPWDPDQRVEISVDFSEFDRLDPLDRFQAILVGAMVADALRQGMLATQAGLDFAGTRRSREALGFKATAAAEETAWGQCLGGLAEQIVNHDPGAIAPSLPEQGIRRLRQGSPVAVAIATLPVMLRYLDQPEQGERALGQLATVLAPAAELTLRQLYRNLQGWLLGGQWPPPSHTENGPPDDPGVAAVTTAWQWSQQAAGDFRLAVGQSLAGPDHLLSILTGAVSAGVSGEAAIPVSWRRAIAGSTTTRHWLQRRWGGADEARLRGWAVGIWQRWMGMSLPLWINAQAGDHDRGQLPGLPAVSLPPYSSWWE